MSLIVCLEKYCAVVVGKVSMIVLVEHRTWSGGGHDDTLKNNMPVEKAGGQGRSGMICTPQVVLMLDGDQIKKPRSDLIAMGSTVPT